MTASAEMTLQIPRASGAPRTCIRICRIHSTSAEVWTKTDETRTS